MVEHPEVAVTYTQEGEYWSAKVTVGQTLFCEEMQALGVSRDQRRALAYALEALAVQLRTPRTTP